MQKYKIVKRVQGLTETHRYFVYHKKRFLWWSWWEKLTVFVDKWLEQEYVMAFDTLEEAKSHLERMDQGLIIEIEND